MVNVAVAGGLGNVGKTIVEVLKEDPKYNVIILSRKSDDNAPAPVKAVDYDNVDALKDLLEAHRIHTVISALSITSEVVSQGEVSLVKAAAASAPTKRFIASDWGAPVPESSVTLPHFALHEKTFAELRKTGLEWTHFHNGYFLDYYGIPHLKSHMWYYPFVIDVANKMAAIPGTGNDVMTFTYTFDVARFVRAALDLPAGEWPETSVVIGDKLTFNDFLKLAEEARGAKFEVKYDPLEKLQTGQITELPGHRQAHAFFPKPALNGMLSVFEQWVIDGNFDLPEENSLNRRFPEIKTLTAKGLLEQFWKGK